MRAKRIFLLIFTVIFLYFSIGLIGCSIIPGLIERAHKLMGPGNVMLALTVSGLLDWIVASAGRPVVGSTPLTVIGVVTAMPESLAPVP